MAGRSYSLGREGAKVTSDPAEAASKVEAGLPVVLVLPDTTALAEFLRSSPDQDRRERPLGVMVGDLSEPEVAVAAAEMASELWLWARS